MEWNSDDGLFTLLGKLVKTAAAADLMERDDVGGTGIHNLALEAFTVFTAVNENPAVNNVLAAAQAEFTSMAVSWRNALRFIVSEIITRQVPAILQGFFNLLELYVSTGQAELFSILRARMLEAEQTVLANTVTFDSPYYGRDSGSKHTNPEHEDNSNLGHASVLVTGTSNEGQAGDYYNEYIFNQAYRLTCISGVNEGSAEGAAIWRLDGQFQADSRLAGGTDRLWEALGAQGSLTELSQLTYTLLSNGDFELFSVTNLPDDWTVEAGVVGSSIFKSSSPYRGDSALRLVTATEARLSQTLAASVSNQRTYVVTARVKRVGAGTGTLTIGPSSDTYAFGGTEVLALLVQDLFETYTLVHVYFNVPEEVPADLKFVVKLVAATGSPEVHVDDVFCAEVVRFRGVGVTVVVGNAPSYATDMATFNAENDYAGRFQTFFGRFFGVSLPSSDTPTLGEDLTE